MSTVSCAALMALRIRVRKSAMGSVMDMGVMRYQLDLVMPGMNPLWASSRRQIRQMPNLRYTARGRPQRRHLLYWRGLFFAGGGGGAPPGGVGLWSLLPGSRGGGGAGAPPGGPPPPPPRAAPPG